MASTIAVLHPQGFPPKIGGIALSPSLPNLEGKTVYLVDGRHANADVLMDEIQRWLSQHMPAVETTIVRWRGPFTDDPDLSEEIRAKADAAIVGAGI